MFLCRYQSILHVINVFEILTSFLAVILIVEELGFYAIKEVHPDVYFIKRNAQKFETFVDLQRTLKALWNVGAKYLVPAQ